MALQKSTDFQDIEEDYLRYQASNLLLVSFNSIEYDQRPPSPLCDWISFTSCRIY